MTTLPPSPCRRDCEVTDGGFDEEAQAPQRRRKVIGNDYAPMITAMADSENMQILIVALPLIAAVGLYFATMEFLGLVGFLEAAGGAVIFLTATTAIQGVEGLVAFGFGVLTMAVARGVEAFKRLWQRRHEAEAEARAEKDGPANEATEPTKSWAGRLFRAPWARW
jgi:hypothetical protein